MKITVYDRTEQDVAYGLYRVSVIRGNWVGSYSAYVRTAPYDDVCHVYMHDRQFRCRKLKLDGPLGGQIAAVVNAVHRRAVA